MSQLAAEKQSSKDENSLLVPVSTVQNQASVTSQGSFLIRDIDPEEEANHHHYDAKDGHGTIWSSAITIVSSLVGGGVFALPAVFHDASIYYGVPALVVIACLTSVTGMMLTYLAEHTKHFAYLQLWHFCTGNKWMTRLVGFTVSMYCFGGCTTFVVVIKDSMGPLARSWLGLTGFPSEGAFWVLIVAPVLFGLSSLRRLNELTIGSIIAFLTILYVGVVVIARFVSGENLPPDDATLNRDEFSGYFFRAISTMTFCFSMHFNIPTLYKELKDRSPYRMSIAISLGFLITFLFYFTVAFMGYLSWGSAIEAHGGDLLAHYSEELTSVNVGRFMMLFHFTFVFPLAGIAARREASVVFFGGERHLTQLTLCIEAFVLVTASCFLAIYAKGISDVVSVSGSVFGIHILLTYPAIMYWQVFKHSMSGVKRAGVIGLMVLGVTLSVLATFYSVKAIQSKQ